MSDLRDITLHLIPEEIINIVIFFINYNIFYNKSEIHFDTNHL